MSEHLEPGREYVVGFMFNQSGRSVLLIHKKRPTWQAGKLNGVGGRVEDFELPALAMRREFLEETGLDHADWHRFCSLRDERGWLVHFFSAIGDITTARQLTDEPPICCGIEFLQAHEVIPNLRWLIPMALTMKHERIDHFEIQEHGANGGAQ